MLNASLAYPSHVSEHPLAVSSLWCTCTSSVWLAARDIQQGQQGTLKSQLDKSCYFHQLVSTGGSEHVKIASSATGSSTTHLLSVKWELAMRISPFETENPNRHGKQPWSLGWVSHFSWKQPLPSAFLKFASGFAALQPLGKAPMRKRRNWPVHGWYNIKPGEMTCLSLLFNLRESKNHFTR